MFFNQSPDENEEKKNEPVSPIREDGSYEIVFDSKKDNNTSYSVGGYNAYGFSPNGSKAPETPKPAKEKKPRKDTTRLFFILATVFFALSVLLTGVNIAMTVSGGKTPTTDGDSITDLHRPDPWTNPAPMESTDVYAAATEKVINSVVVINCDNASGSGVIWATNSSLSYILTCHHVIDGASEIKITLYSGETLQAEVVGSDARTDIAILKVSTPNLPPVILPHADSELKLGQSVIAVGNPLGSLGNSVSNGILSSLSRTVSIEGTTMELIQTNAAVNSGNSGGGLFDMNGQLIGLVNAKVVETTVEGIGFAIPFRTLQSVAAEIIEKGYVAGRPRLGITTVTVNGANYREIFQRYPDLEAYAVKNDRYGNYLVAGIYIIDTSLVAGYGEGSETLQYGDRLRSIGAVDVTSSDDVMTILNQYNAGDTVEISVVRQNKTVIIELILGELGK